MLPCCLVSVSISHVPERHVSSWTTKSAPRKHQRVLLNPTRPCVWIHVEVVDLPIGCMNRIHTDSIVFPLRWAALSGEIVWVSERANTEGDETKTAAKSRSAEPEELADPVASFAIRSLSLRQREMWHGSPCGSFVPETTQRRVIVSHSNPLSKEKPGPMMEWYL